MIQALLTLTVLLLGASSVWAQAVEVTNTAVGQAVSIRCVNTAGAAFEGCGGAGTTDTDDGSVAVSQTGSLQIGLSHAFDGTVWRRLTFGVAGTASAQVLTVQGIASMTPFLVGDGVGAFNVICDSGCTAAASFEDNDAFTVGMTAVNIFAGLFDDVMPTAATENSAAAVRMSANRNFYAQLRDAAGNERGVNVTAGNALVVDGSAATQPVSGTVTANLSATDNAVLDDIADGIAVTATNLDVQSGGADVLSTTAHDAAFGTAGTADAQVRTVQGIASGTPVIVDLGANNDVTITSGTVTTVSTVTTLSQFGGAAINLGSGPIDTGTLRLAIATDDPVNDAAVETSAAIGATAAAVPASATQIGGTDGTSLVVPYIDPCQREARTTYVVDIVTATTTEIANAVASEFFYLCSVSVFSAGTQNVAIVEDDTDACTSPTAGLNGGVTAAEGYNFTAQTGIVTGVGSHYVMKTATANRYLCIITSAAVQVSGTITYVSAP